MKKEYDVLKIYNNLYIISAIYFFLLDCITNKFNGSMPAELFSPSRKILFCGFLIHIIPLFLVYPIFKRTKNIHIKFKQIPTKVWYFDESKIHWVVFAVMTINLIFATLTGVGKADSSNRTQLSFLLRIIPPEPLMLLYFVFVHKTKKVIFWINFCVFGMYSIITGWTGFILEYAFIELFFWVKYSKKVSFPVLKFGFICDSVFIVLGGIIYSFLRPLKFAIRYGYSYGGRNTFYEGIFNLVSRLTDYEATVVSIINHDKIVQLYKMQGIWYWEAISVFKNVLPRFVMPHKDYRVLGNILMQSFYSDVESTTSTGYGLLCYGWNLFNATLPGMILWIIIYLLLFIVCKHIIQMFDAGNGDSDVLYFVMLMKVIQGTPINVSIGCSYLEFLYAMILFPLLKIIKKKQRIKRN